VIDAELLRIGEVARRAGVRTSLIRYYEDVGLLPRPTRVSGQRRYDHAVLRRLKIIDVAQRAGMSLDDIRVLLEHGTDPVSNQMRELAARKLPEVDALIARAERVRTWLQTAAGCSCQSIDECGLFDEHSAEPHVTPFTLNVNRIGPGTAA
jgi:MerR family transcriptional regulator, redox-sensitive transcriptional activator SoxR